MNKHQHKARKAKNDEYYTLYSDVAAEILPHRHQLKGKRVHCPFSDCRKSQVVIFLVDFFHILRLAHLTATCLDNGEGAWRFDYDGRLQLSHDSPRVVPLILQSAQLSRTPAMQ